MSVYSTAPYCCAAARWRRNSLEESPVCLTAPRVQGSIPEPWQRYSCRTVPVRCAAHLVYALRAQHLHQRVAAVAAGIRAAVRVRLAVPLLVDAVLLLHARAVAELCVLRRDGTSADRSATIHSRLPAHRHRLRSTFPSALPHNRDTVVL